MTVVSGEVPYTYLDLPFSFKGRGPGSVGVPWQDEGTPIPEPSGYLFEQAMFVHLAELRKYAEPDLETHHFWNYKAGVVAGASKEPIYDPDPIGANISPSGNTNCLNFVKDLRSSFDKLCMAIATDSLYTSGQIKRDYFQATFSGLPSGRAGDYQYRIWDKPLFFGPINQSGLYYVGASGYLDSQTLNEISYQPYARFSRRGTKILNNITYETAPIFPAVIGSDGSFPTIGADETVFYDGSYSELGAPQSSGYNVDGLASGYLRICGDALNSQSRFYVVSNSYGTLFASDSGKRWIGKAEDRNRSESSYLLETNGFAYITTSAQNLPHGVHKAIIATPSVGYGAVSGALSVYPSDSFYNTTGWIGALIGTNGSDDVIRNKSGGVPDNGVTTQPSGGGVVNRSLGIHVCDQLFGARNSSGVVNVSPFNCSHLYLNAVANENHGSDGLIYNAYLEPRGIYWVVRQQYHNGSVFWDDGTFLVQAEYDNVAYGYVRSAWVRRSFSVKTIIPPDPYGTFPNHSTVGLGQTELYSFVKFDTTSRSISLATVSYNHISRNRGCGISRAAWSRNYGWFGAGGSSINDHRFETYRIIGDPDSGSFMAAASGPLSLSAPIGIGSLSFMRRSTDISAGNRVYWSIQLGNSDGYYTALLNPYDVVVDGDVPFSTGDITPTFIGHTIFIDANSEGITPGDWVVVATTKGRYLCRVEVDSDAYELQLVECLCQLQSGATPEIFMNL